MARIEIVRERNTNETGSTPLCVFRVFTTLPDLCNFILYKDYS